MPLLIPKYLSTSSPAFAIGLLALGILLGLLAYTVFLAFSTKEKMFLYFSVIMSLLVILQTFAAYERFFFYLTYNRVTIITHLLFITFLLFFEDFFSLSAHKPRLSAFNRFSIYLILGYTLFFLTAKAVFPDAVGFHGVLNFIRELFVFYTNIIFIVTIITALQWMHTEALLILIAFIPPALLTSINAMNIFPFMRRYKEIVTFLMQYNQPIGLSLQAILFSLAMGNRYNRIKLEREQSREESARLAQLNKERTEFYTNMSHELRTPLTIILGTIQQIRKGEYGDSIRKNTAQFSTIERNCLRLFRQVSAMLRIDQPPSEIRKEKIPLAEGLRMILADFSVVAAEKDISLSFLPSDATQDSMLSIAFEDFEALIMNLVSNALKYCPRGSKIEVSTTLQPKSGDLIMSVSDTGPGIPAEHFDAIFLRYHRVSEDRDHFSTGLGLPLVKTIIESYGGDISIQSTLGQGSCFSLRFPSILVESMPTSVLQKANSLPADSFLRAAQQPFNQIYTAELLPHETSYGSSSHDKLQKEKPCILLVEDNYDMQTYISSVLSEHFSVISASSGEEALAILDVDPVDVIVSDIMMKSMDGHAFLAEVRKRHRGFPLPLIFLTARHSQDEKIESLREGAIRYITKPFVPSELIEGIHTILHHDRELAHSQVERIRKDMELILNRVDHQPQSDTHHRDLQAEALAVFFQTHELSAREQEVVRCIISGMSDKEIAASLEISPRTVANHNRAIYRKIGTATRFELISKVLSQPSDSTDVFHKQDIVR